MPLTPSDLAEGVGILLRDENREFVERLHFVITNDPEYLTFYKASTALVLRRKLWQGGLYVRTDDDAIEILKEAMKVGKTRRSGGRQQTQST